jgi:hypothetical protein
MSGKRPFETVRKAAVRVRQRPLQRSGPGRQSTSPWPNADKVLVSAGLEG